MEDLPPKKLRAFSVWRKDLCHLNKTRDNHFMRFGKCFDFYLVVRANAEIGTHIEALGTNLIQVNTVLPSFFGFIEFYCKTTLVFLRLRRIHNFNFILAAHGEEPVGWFLKLLVGKSVKLVFDLWDIPGLALKKEKITFKEILRCFYQNLLIRLVNKADLVIAGVIKDGLKPFNIDSNKIIESENGVFLDKFNPDLDVYQEYKYWPENDSELKLVYVGYLHEARGSGELIKAVRNICHLGKKINLLLVGPSDAQSVGKLERLVQKYQIDESVKIMSEVSSDSIPSIIQGADVCVCPLADIEKFKWSYPVKVYEYLAMAKPVIASDLPGVAHLVKDGENGFLYPAGDVQQLSGAICKFLDRPVLLKQMGQEARRSVLTKDWDVNVEQTSKKIERYFDESK